MSNDIVLLDTNVIAEAGNLDSLSFRAARKIARSSGIEIGITSITFEESVNLVCANAREWIDQLARSSRRLGALIDLTTFIPGISEIEAIWEQRLRENFRVYGVDGRDAIEALRREARRVAPAKEKGVGARDCAIWLTALRLAREGCKVYLVTHNSQDFGSEGEFKPELQAEIVADQLAIEYASSIRDLLAKLTNPSEVVIAAESIDAASIMNGAFMSRVRIDDTFSSLEISTAEVSLEDAEVSFSNLTVDGVYKLDVLVVVVLKADYLVDMGEEGLSPISGNVECFAEYDLQFEGFRPVDPADMKIISSSISATSLKITEV
ncbi:PIN domain-containing protein [Tsukamurella paurometabola]|uniref:DUF4935 domain-containing protein n=1 Tax=Tsukamurella paurometabola TaxID=2061 RepID=A0A3P8LHG1_TSUPA|nr:PIN domain-containing protein [Tsukamurella paurometabola]UEA84211.1 PIN domain-containing protein [Tsukamurella paurometabola]VDR41382.1 Uncharacterised protein [Tsukamurella paurometabola]